MILVDTNVLSEAMSPFGAEKVKDAIAEHHDSLQLSAVVMGEILYGVAILPEGRRRAEVQSIYDYLTTIYADRILPVTHDIAEIWGRLRAASRAERRPLALADGLIAATALHHNLTLMTRNTRDFDQTGVKLLNPWEG